MRATVRSLVLLFTAVLPAHAAEPIVYTVRAGLLDHDTRLANGIEGGVDLSGEVQFASPVPSGWSATLPSWLEWFARPRPTFGAEINTDGYTSQGFIGAVWTPLRFERVFSSLDALTLDLGFAPAFNGGYTDTVKRDHKSLGSNVLLRTSAEIGYAITPAVGVYVLYTHSSNAGLGRNNPGLNDIGLRLGYRF